MSPSVSDLHNAILTNSVDIVESSLAQGCVNPNHNHATLLPVWTFVVDHFGNVHPNCTVATSETTFASISSLHLAILNCFHSTKPNSLAILKLLLEHGANVTLTMSGIYLGLMVNGKWSFVVAENNMTPLQLANALKKHLSVSNNDTNNHQAQQEDILYQVTTILMNVQTTQDSFDLSKTFIPTCIVDNWRNMLLSSEFCDCKFVCDNGSTFVCHKAVLAAASDYFRNYFLEKWTTHHPDDTWKTRYSPQVVWAVLTFVYAGAMPLSVAETHASELLLASHEYRLPELYQIAIAKCMGSITVETVVSFLKLAHQCQSKTLEQACLEFVKANNKNNNNNAASILTNPQIQVLAKENPNLWKELMSAVSSPQDKEQQA